MVVIGDNTGYAGRGEATEWSQWSLRISGYKKKKNDLKKRDKKNWDHLRLINLILAYMYGRQETKYIKY